MKNLFSLLTLVHTCTSNYSDTFLLKVIVKRKNETYLKVKKRKIHQFPVLGRAAERSPKNSRVGQSTPPHPSKGAISCQEWGPWQTT
ncbi:hypothetical protein V8C43DRAFT_292830 [Trichoderma afarasin]